MPAQVRTKYQADDGAIHAIRLNPNTAAVAGAPPAGAVDSSLRVKVTKGNNEFGIRPRRVTIGKEFGVAPDTFIRTAYIPVLTPAGFAAAGFQLNAAILYKGQAGWEVIAREPEDY